MKNEDIQNNSPLSAEEKEQQICYGSGDLLSLDFTSAEDREIAVRCLDKRIYLSAKLNPDIWEHREVLKVWIRKNYRNIFSLRIDQRHKDLVNIYLEEKYNEQLKSLISSENANKGAHKDNEFNLSDCINLIHSYSGQQLIIYKYATKEGEVVCYFDNTLGVPAKLKTNADFRIKIIDALALVKKIDIELERIGLTKTIEFINNIINDNLRETLLNIIENNKITYYELPRYYRLIIKQLKTNLQDVFNECGLLIDDIKINDISLTNNMDDILEKEYFNLARIAHEKEAENKINEMSLKLYEQKAMIHEKYPNFQMGLTEAEKDRALSRYLERLRNEKKTEPQIKNEALAKIGIGEDEITNNSNNDADEAAPVKVITNKYRYIYGIAFAIWLIASITLTYIETTRALGIVILSVGAVLLILLGYFWRIELIEGMTRADKKIYEDSCKAYENRLNDKRNYESEFQKNSQEKEISQDTVKDIGKSA